MPTRFQPVFPIATARLDLRPHRTGDLEDLLMFHSDPEVVRYIPWPVRDREETAVALDLKTVRDSIAEEGDWLILAVELRETGQVIGEVLLKWDSELHRRGEIGFALSTAFHGQGLAREAAAAVLDYGFGEMQLHRIIGRCDARNDASARLLLALGMHQEAHLREHEFFKGEWIDDLVFGILRDEWLS